MENELANMTPGPIADFMGRLTRPEIDILSVNPPLMPVRADTPPLGVTIQAHESIGVTKTQILVTTMEGMRRIRVERQNSTILILSNLRTAEQKPSHLSIQNGGGLLRVISRVAAAHVLELENGERIEFNCKSGANIELFDATVTGMFEARFASKECGNAEIDKSIPPAEPRNRWRWLLGR